MPWPILQNKTESIGQGKDYSAVKSISEINENVQHFFVIQHNGDYVVQTYDHSISRICSIKRRCSAPVEIV